MALEPAAARILLTGKEGQVGFELQRALSPLGEVFAMGRADCDLADPDAIRAMVEATRPTIIVNPAAYTAVDKAETERALAFAVNALAPAVLAEEAAKTGALLVHYSTDYVFDGRKQGAYLEQDLAAPQSVYGMSKLAGEEAIRSVDTRHLILRTSWVFGVHGKNFLKTILRLARERDGLRVVADQIGAPTSAALIADVTADILGQYLRDRDKVDNPDRFGTFHLTASGETSWHGYARSIVATGLEMGMPIKMSPGAISPISTDDYPVPAPRPANSRLNTEKLKSTFNLVLPDWRVGVTDVLNRLKI
jgi:dTDP-4-dehydrorhamnose reductase